ncbi:MAG: hypothetical protein WCG50_17175 [Rhodoferax sp.]|uniref:hypothetical protein n=1 Tax=Rhodoferax sp. TaxID=50421 RepID=UPI0030189B8F
MALTNNEKQAAYRIRQQKTMSDLAEANKELHLQNVSLLEEAKHWEGKYHALELRTLKAELKASQANLKNKS